ncbi:zinc finger protein JAGGED-like [Heracleum sosnowskyi]|uniref:Zinc finger protein JAGGED-like n=1 Tax=Heracleum sosnowskyi TaxID=360622 RepID=A0AAD8HY37_9APIA|nr:zinc finger protein JAGGED-like [Heracleum sosnowskyi]
MLESTIPSSNRELEPFPLPLYEANESVETSPPELELKPLPKTSNLCTMRPGEGNPLDLNNLPGDDYFGAAGGGQRKKKNGRENDESGKVYECRFCSLKFGKSQALGGHMNRHRQERETETLNRARQLVFSNDNLIRPTPPHHLLGGQLPISHGGYQHHETSDTLRAATGYPPARYYCGSSSSTNVPLPESYMYHSPPRQLVPYPPTHYKISPPINDYFVGHAVLSTPQLPTYTTHEAPAPPVNNYTCIGAPVGRGRFVQGSGEDRDTSSTVLNNNNNNYYSSTSNNNEEEEEGEESEEGG